MITISDCPICGDQPQYQADEGCMVCHGCGCRNFGRQVYETAVDDWNLACKRFNKIRNRLFGKVEI
jgi:hypothetical protein